VGEIEMPRRWIQKAVKHKGSLTAWARKHKFIKDGRISIGRAMRYAKRHGLTKRIRQLNLAKTLRRLRR